MSIPEPLPVGAPTLLAIDSGSPVVSVAVGRGGGILARRSIAQIQSSERLLGLVDEALAEAHLALARLDGLIALQGPGSFTGLRVGLATLLGLHQATGIPATALPTLEVLASAAPAGEAGETLAVADALRGEWYVQPFAPGPLPIATAAVERWPLARFCRHPRTAVVVGFGASRLPETAGWPARLSVAEPEPLAAVALRWAYLAPPTWEVDRLVAPLYLRPPAITPPRP